MHPPFKLIFVKDGERQEFTGVDAQTILPTLQLTEMGWAMMKQGATYEMHGGHYSLEGYPDSI